MNEACEWPTSQDFIPSILHSVKEEIRGLDATKGVMRVLKQWSQGLEEGRYRKVTSRLSSR